MAYSDFWKIAYIRKNLRFKNFSFLYVNVSFGKQWILGKWVYLKKSALGKNEVFG
jgi:hypothetical protein